jgi:chromosome segregation ATPase
VWGFLLGKTMDIFTLIDRINEILLTPEVFRYFLPGLGGLSLLVILAYLFQSKRRVKKQVAKDTGARQYWEAQLKECMNKNSELAKKIVLLESRIENKDKEIASFNILKEELKKKEESLRNETVAREKVWTSLKEAENQLSALRKDLEVKQESINGLEQLRQGLNKKDQELNEREDEIGNLRAELTGAKEQLNSSEEVYSGLKEQYADLELQVDAINQSFALEKTLHNRLKEEHAKCPKPPPAVSA